nr:transcription factor SPT20 homolog [Onthophagus taurus]
MVSRNFIVLCLLILVVSTQANDQTTKRDKRTVDLFLRGVGDVFGYDVIRRVSSPQILRQVATTPRPTFFPPAVGPLPSGSYSRIILQLQQQQEQQRQQEQNNLFAAPINNDNNSKENLVLPQGAIILPLASLLTAPVGSQNVQSSQQTQQLQPQQLQPQQLQPQQIQPQQLQPQQLQPQQLQPQQLQPQQLQPQQLQPQQIQPQLIQVQQPQQQQNVAVQGVQSGVSRQISSTTAKPDSAQIGLPWQIVALAPVIGQQQENALAQQNQAQIPAPQPTASLTPSGLNVSFDSGPTRLNLLESPRSEAIRRTFNLNLNWNRDVEPPNSAALIQVPIQVQTTIAPQQQLQQMPQSAALINQPQNQEVNSQIENFDVPPQSINNLNNLANLNQLNEPSQRKLNADFRQSIRKFWETSPWSENLRSEDGKEQDNAQNYFDESDNPKSEDIQEEEQESRESSSEETSNEVRMEERTTSSFRAPQKFKRRYTKVKKSVDAIKREKKSSKFVPEDEEKQVKGYYKRFVVSRKTRDIGSKEEYEPMKYTRDEYQHNDPYTKDFSYSPPEEDNKDKHELEPEMEKFDVEADIPKKSKVRTKESKSGFNIVKITKKTKVIKE